MINYFYIQSPERINTIIIENAGPAEGPAEQTNLELLVRAIAIASQGGASGQ